MRPTPRGPPSSPKQTGSKLSSSLSPPRPAPTWTTSSAATSGRSAGCPPTSSALLDRFARIKAERLAQLDLVDAVSHTAPRLVGWIQVAGGARVEELGWDPDAERSPVSRVVAELESLGWSIDDRQTAGLGYDLFARRPGTTDQRLVEVKGFTGDLDAVGSNSTSGPSPAARQ